jgi:hypothetical protein
MERVKGAVAWSSEVKTCCRLWRRAVSFTCHWLCVAGARSRAGTASSCLPQRSSSVSTTRRGLCSWGRYTRCWTDHRRTFSRKSSSSTISLTCVSVFCCSPTQARQPASRPGPALPPDKEPPPPVPTVQEAGWAPEPVWTQRLEEKSSVSVGDRTPAVRSVVRHCTHCTGGWVGPRAGLDAEVRGKILCFCRGSNPGRPVRSQTLHWLYRRLGGPQSRSGRRG